MIRETLYSIKEYLEKKMDGEATVELDMLRKEADAKEHDIIITLLHIEEETSRKSQSFYWPVAADDPADGQNGSKKYADRVIKSPDVDLNLEILISSHASNYESALKQISNVISIMNSIKTASKPEKIADDLFNRIKSLNISLVNKTFEQHLSMWQTIGSPIVPSVVYKVRTLTIAGLPDTDAIKAVRKVNVETGRMDIKGEKPVTFSAEQETSGSIATKEEQASTDM